MPADRKVQDYRSTYNDIRDWRRRETSAKEKEQSSINWDDVTFEVDLLKSQEINLGQYPHFINKTDLDQINDKASVIGAFFAFAQAEQRREAEELIKEEGLNTEAAKRYIITSIKREYASESGTELNAVLPKMSPLNPKYLSKKQNIFQKIAAFVEKLKGVGGTL